MRSIENLKSRVAPASLTLLMGRQWRTLAAMCGRFALYALPEEIRSRFGLSGAPHYVPSYNIAPTQTILGVALGPDGERLLGRYRWGLIPHWAREIGRYSTINARAETVATKPAYRGPFREHRILIPASGYYEWKQGDDGKRPYFIHPRDGQLMAFAGLWDRWQPPGGHGATLVSAAIIVTQANADTRTVHERMPVILSPEDWDTWLDPNRQDGDCLSALLCPAPSGTLDAYPVSTAVNSPRNNQADLLTRQSNGK